MNRNRLAALLTAAMLFCTGCASSEVPDGSDVPMGAAVTKAFSQSVEVKDADPTAELAVLATDPAVINGLMPVASGTQVKENASAVIDYSNTADGYVMVKYTASTSKKLKAQVKGPSGVTYTYNLTAGADYATFPLSDGNGSYQVSIFENISGTSYSTVLSVSFTAALKDEFAPFLLPNQYVNYTPESKTVAKAAELTSGVSDTLKKVQKVYEFVVDNISYDYEKAASVKSGYLPVLDTVLAQKKGICFDYAALMTAMLRSQDVPTKLVVGYSGDIYHAWINVYSPESGWVENVVYFDGTTWKLMDPTFASTGNQSKEIMKYIGDGKNYSAKYIY